MKVKSNEKLNTNYDTKVSSKKSLLKPTIVVLVFSSISKIFSAIFKLPLTSLIGSEGMGIYQLVFPLFVFLFTLSSHGTSMAITTEIAKQNAKSGYVKFGLFWTFVASVFLAFLLVVFAPTIAKFQGRSEIFTVYYIIAILVVSVSILGYNKGILRGFKDFNNFGFLDILEQIAKVVFALGFAFILIKKETLVSVSGVFVGILLSTVIAIFVSLVMLKKNKNNFALLDNTALTKQEKKEFLSYSIFVSLSALILPLVQFLDSVLVVNILDKYNTLNLSSIQLFGLSRGTANAILNLPIVFVYALEVVLLPNIVSETNSTETNKKLNLAINLVGFICLPVSFVLFLFSTPICTIFFGQSLTTEAVVVLSKLIQIGSLYIFLAGIMQVFVIVLQGLNNFKIALFSIAFSGIVRIISTIFLTVKWSVFGAEWAVLIFYAVGAVLTFFILLIKRYKIKLWSILLIALVSAFSVGIAFILYNKLLVLKLSVVWSLILSLLLAVFLYFSLFGIVLLLNKKKYKSQSLI